MSQKSGAKKYKAKEFRVAVEGGTTDGRTIQRNWLTEAAATYSRELYGARGWVEHLRSISPDGMFGAYADVLSLRAAEVADGPLKGRMALYATIEPLESLVALTNDKKQKIYTSIEIDPNFAKTGSAYCMGIGFTDTPASLGTSILEFASKNPDANPFKGRKFSANSVITEAVEQEMAFELDEGADDSGGKFKAWMTGFVAKFSAKAKTDDEKFEDVKTGFNAIGEQFTKQGEAQAKTAQDLEAATKRIATLETQYSDIKKVLDNTDARQFNQRPPATGGTGQQLTDC
ncbi:GPO family capsid scaffolding protein [Azohydromonas lata]|nr:GPO family capsid scaffolding protein [Azohydromonas lata]